MAIRFVSRTALGCGLAVALIAAGTAAAAWQASQSLNFTGTRVAIAGSSNVHDYTAATTTLRVVAIDAAVNGTGAAAWEELLKPGSIRALEVAVPAATLTSGKDGLDKNMHKALKAPQHADIVFKLTRLEAVPGNPAARKAIGMLKIAGVEREVTMNLTTALTAASLSVKGEFQLLMTDFGIAPPKAMLGMLKTDPKVTVTFETTLTLPLAASIN
jgi:polyisoprenoid-binding protein YceI